MRDPNPLDLSLASKKRRERRKKERRIQSILFVALLVILIVGAILLWNFLSKHGRRVMDQSLRSLMDETAGVLFLTPTATFTDTPTPTVPTATPTATQTPTPTMTPTMTLSPTPKLRPRITVEGSAADLLALAEVTQEAIHAMEAQKAAGTVVPEEWFELNGNPAAFDASLVYENADCTWMGVAGVLLDRRAEPQIGYYVQIGFTDGGVIETLSGLFPNYGESGYELTIARPVQTFESPVWIQVLNGQRVPVSERFYFRPSSQCEKSLTVINYQRIR